MADKSGEYKALIRSAYAADSSPILGELERLYTQHANTVANLLRMKAEQEQVQARLEQLSHKRDEVAREVTDRREKIEDLSRRMKEISRDI